MTVARRARLGIEFAALFVGLPLAFRFEAVPPLLFPFLWLLAIVCFGYLWLDPTFERARLARFGAVRSHAVAVFVPFLLCALPLLGLTAWLAPERLFGLYRERTGLWALIVVLYPLLSVYPQGVVYRVFLMHRYRALFVTPFGRIAASALAFSFAHIVFRNPVAPVLTLVGGLAFAWTYERTRSAGAAAVQHALFGDWLFTVGLGWYFYFGAVAKGG